MDEIEQLKAKRICDHCIGEAYLSQDVKNTGKTANCDYCNQARSTWQLEQLTERIETAFEAHYIRTSDQPDSWQERLLRDRESNYEWYRDGQPVAEAFQEAALIDDVVANDVHTILDDKYGCHDPSDSFDETEFFSDSHYELKSQSDATWQEAWLSFERSIQHTARFFSRDASEYLSRVFNGIDTLVCRSDYPAITDAGPQTATSYLYRARVFQSEKHLLDALEHPEKELGPPPPDRATAGRMNAQGISIFYGATSETAAISEVRPPVGSRIAVAKFHIVRPLRLLDLTALEHVYAEGSIFDAAFKDKLERVAFLRSLGKRISRAVMPDDQTFDYLVTQVVADYLAAGNCPALDGIIFESAQVKEGRNIVLFYKASKVACSPFPTGSEIHVSPGYTTEDGFEYDYTVQANLPHASLMGPAPSIEGAANFQSLEAAFLHYQDPRTVTLRLDPESIMVHHVNSVQFECLSHKVNHYITALTERLASGF